MKVSSPITHGGTNSTQPRRGEHLVAATEVRILLVILLLVALMVVGAGRASSTAASATRASAALGVNTNLDAVDAANVALEAAFERAGAHHDLAARASVFSTASAIGTKGTTAFSTYVQRSLKLPGEATARAAYERKNDAWGVFAGRFGPTIVNPATSDATIATATARLHDLHLGPTRRG